MRGHSPRISFRNVVYSTAWNICLVSGRGNPEFRQEFDSTLFYVAKPKAMDTREAPHIGNLIKAELARQGRSTRWLSKQIGCTRQNMYYLLSRSFIYTDQLLKICDALDYNFFKCYSDYMVEKKLSKDI